MLDVRVPSGYRPALSLVVMELWRRWWGTRSPGATGRQPCFEMAGAAVPRLLVRSLRGSDTLLGVRSAARGMVLSRRRAPRALPTQGERTCV